MKNLEKIDRFSKSISASSIFPREEEIRTFEAERIKLLNDLSTKDEAGKPIIKPDNNFDLTPENLELFNVQYEALKEKNKELIDQKVESDNVVKAKLEEENDYVLYKVDYSNLPTDLTSEEIFAIRPMIMNFPEEQNG